MNFKSQPSTDKTVKDKDLNLDSKFSDDKKI